jgi:hypothetical protein
MEEITDCLFGNGGRGSFHQILAGLVGPLFTDMSSRIPI